LKYKVLYTNVTFHFITLNNHKILRNNPVKSLPEKPQSINTQLWRLPAYQPTLAPVIVSETSQMASRVIASLMQLKDTANILLLLSNGTLLFGICMGFGVPGLVLYGLRWRQVRGRAKRGGIIGQTLLSLLHELFWANSFYKERDTTEPFEHHEILVVLYGLGALLSAIHLLVAVSVITDKHDYCTDLADEHSIE
jgi:Na+/proline symporter